MSLTNVLLPVFFALAGLYACYAIHQESIGDHRFCKNGTCSTLSRSRYSHLIIFPNWIYGTIFYAAVIVQALLSSRLLTELTLVASILSLIFSVILVWSLVVKLRTVCVHCYVGHVCNLAIFILLLLRLY